MHLSINRANDTHVNVTVYAAGEQCGALIFDRRVWDALHLTEDDAQEGQMIEVELVAKGQEQRLGGAVPRSSRAARETAGEDV